MKKQLILTKDGDDYILSIKNQNDRFVKIKNKIIQGEDIYNTFYKNVTDEIHYEINTELSDSKDKIICQQLSNLFMKIDSEINKDCFNKEIEEKKNE